MPRRPIYLKIANVPEVRMNCWEFKRCHRERSCPAFPDHGHHCARVAGTLCGGKVQGAFATKLVNCMECDFYKSAHYDKHYQGRN